MLVFSEVNLKLKLANLSAFDLSTFSWSCAARLLPGFFQWHEHLSLPPPKDVQQIFDSGLDRLKSGATPIPSDALLETADALLVHMPDETAEWSMTRPIAEDAIASLCYGLRCLATGDPQEAVWAARRGYESADQLGIFDRSGVAKPLPSEDLLCSHPIVQKELERQNRDVKLILQGKHSAVLHIVMTESVFDV